MTLVRLGYVAMSSVLQNCSPSQTMSYTRFKQIHDREAALRKLERLAQSNIENCLRLLKHNLAHDIHFFRLSSKLVPLATHEDLKGWRYIRAIESDLRELGDYARDHDMRIDFHPGQFYVLNSPKEEVLHASLYGLRYFRRLVRAMKIQPRHSLVIHAGGIYNDKESALERFIENWAYVPFSIQKMIMLENDDKSFTLRDILYLCEKLEVPLVFDYHHHLANHDGKNWIKEWPRVIETWARSPRAVKMHISSPKSQKAFRQHADYVDPEMFLRFLSEINGSVPQIDCMIESKQKDKALFQLMEDLKTRPEIEMVDEASFSIR